MGIVISTNGGSSWTPVKICNQGGSRSLTAAFAPSNPSILYVSGITASGAGLFYKSRNGGLDWVAVTPPIKNACIGSIAVDPRDSDIVYVAIDYYGIWRSMNSGTSWTKCKIPTTAYYFWDMAINKNNPKEVFVGSQEGVFYSQDRGLTWTDLTLGLSVSDIVRLYFNATTRTLYAGTNGGGLWKRTL